MLIVSLLTASLGIHSRRHTSRTWLDSVGTPILWDNLSCAMRTYARR